MLDIDHFKHINDTFGHLAGDDYLKSVAAILKGSFKRCTDVIARYGGEEFAILLPSTPLADAVTLAESLRQNIAATSHPKRKNRPSSHGQSWPGRLHSGSQDPARTPDQSGRQSPLPGQDSGPQSGPLERSALPAPQRPVRRCEKGKRSLPGRIIRENNRCFGIKPSKWELQPKLHIR
jgi:hypothetical protein